MGKHKLGDELEYDELYYLLSRIPSLGSRPLSRRIQLRYT